MPAPKRIKCAGQADEQLIADLENQLENRANEIYENDEVYRYHDQYYHQHRKDDEEWPIWAYIGIGMIIGLVLVFGWFLFLRAEPEKAVAPTTPPAGTPQEEEYNTEQIAFTRNGAIDKTKPPQERSLVNELAPVASVAAVGSALAYQQNVGGFRDKIQSGLQSLRQKVKEPEVHIPTAGECRAQGQILNGDKCVETTWSENPKEKAEDLANTVVDTNVKAYDAFGGDIAHGLNQIPGVEIDNKTLQPSSYGACGVLSPFQRAWGSITDKWTQFKESGFFWPVIVAALSAFVWFLPALAALLPGSAQTMLAPATGLINQGKGAILGMMEPAGPLLGTP